MKFLLFLFASLPLLASAQNSNSDSTLSKLGQHPMYIVDSVKITTDDFMKFDPNTIASLDILTDTDATKKYGDAAKDGAIFIVTKTLARREYTSYFRQKSKAYDSVYTAVKSDSTFQYIINDKIKGENAEGDLALIDDDLFISLEILTADDLKQKYNITGKPLGVLVKCRKPKNLRNVDKHF